MLSLAPPLNIPSLLTLMTNYIEFRQNWFSATTILFYPALKGLRRTFLKSSGSLPYAYPVLYMDNIAQFKPHSATVYMKIQHCFCL